MWTKLIELILTWWKDKPRKDVVRAVVRLRERMSDCQQWYDELQTAKQSGNVDHPPDYWWNSVAELGCAIEEIDQVVSIYSPEAREALRNYHMFEAREMVAEGVVATTAEALGTKATDIDIEKQKLGPSFKTALDTLDAFIRATFKVEEVHAAAGLRFA